MVESYLQNIFNTFQKGDAREESYYEHLASFLRIFSEQIKNKKIDITILPKKTEAGNPDFRIWDGKQKIIGYIEAKDLGADLSRIEDTQQIQRYISTFPNVILTNFTEFRLYRNGELLDTVTIARPFIIKKLSTVPPAENIDKFFEILERFLDFSLSKTYTAKTLAIELAKRTKFLKDEIISEELKNGSAAIQSFYEAFKEYLIAGINEEEFADLYSQTLAYGLFAARLRADSEFNRKSAYSFIPKSIGILRDIFKFISLEDLPKQLEVIVDDISDVLSIVDVKSILEQYYNEGKGSDPVLHFYETFLSVYDPETREKRGVYYTPEPVISFIVRSINEILKEKFRLFHGLSESKVTLLDPAAGTLGFIAKAIEVATEEHSGSGKALISAMIKDHILQNFYAFELMMAPYAIGHMKISFLLEELGYRLSDNERVKCYLTNTLEMKELEISKFPGMSSLSAESHEAGKIKKEIPILVILGNPPYSGHSANTGEWISEQIKEYYKVDGKPLKEKNPKWLQDDYVKFIRFAQWKIEQVGEGILGFITNHSYIDNPTFRGMRQSLMNTFDEIYILDLHGNSLKKEKAPDGSKDENVFDIQQGVAISFFIKYKEKKKTKIFHSEIFGLREEKYNWLSKHDIKKVKWQRIYPAPEFYLFIPSDNKLANKYFSFDKITEIFPVNSVGIVTARDKFVIDFDKHQLEMRIKQFVNLRIDDEIIRKTFDLSENRSWKLSEKRKILREDPYWEKTITKILYRPFDERWILYHDEMIERPRREVMKHMLSQNLGLITIRRSRSQEEWNFAFVSDKLIAGATAITALDINYIFPLYLYHRQEQKRKASVIQLMLFEPEDSYVTKVPNIRKELIEELNKNFKKKVLPEDIFYYVYSILYSNVYRKKFSEFLRIDFPRIPFTKNYKLFKKLGSLGKALVDLHLLQSEKLGKINLILPGEGNNKVENVRFEQINNETGRVWFNKKQYFDKINIKAFYYKIGGYQVCEKWLKDKKDRTLSYEDFSTYYKIEKAILETINIQKEIDKFFPEVEKTL